MKTIITITFAFALSMCQSIAQSFNIEISENNKTSLQGKINKEGLSKAPYGDWFTKNYEAYSPDTQTVNAIKNKLDGITITAFMGTWCGDSKKEVPKFYKLLDEADFPLERLTMVGVSRERDTYKQSPGGEEEGLNVHRVPTFIFYKDGKEINRFVEQPVTTLEDDILQLLQGNYTSSYNSVDRVDKLLAKHGSQKFENKLKRIAKEVRPFSKSFYELNTYSLVLLTSRRSENAVLVAKLNTLLYPEEANAYVSLGNKLYKTNRTLDAKNAYQKALQLDPENKQAMEALTKINNGGES